MNKTMKMFVMALLLSLGMTAAAQATTSPVYMDQKGPTNKLNVAVLYSELHTNAPVGYCDCFWMEGGSAEVALPLSRYISLVGEVGGEHTPHMGKYTTSLDLFSGAIGARAILPTRRIYQPFGQAMIGGIHGFNSLFPWPQAQLDAGKIPTPDDTSMLLVAGGGLDLAVSHHWWIRAAQADYHYSELRNSQGDRQNQFRLSAGVVWRK